MSESNEFPQTDLNRVSRRSKRGRYDRETIYAILDEALICHVGFVQDGQPFVIPTIHARDGDRLILHGSRASRLLPHVEAGNPVCVAVTLFDGIVFARSIFEHSMNYRSAVLFGRGRAIVGDAEKLRASEVLAEHIARGRWREARHPNRKELDATLLMSLEIESASAKVRAGPPLEEREEDFELPVWAGVLPFATVPQPPIDDSRLLPGVVAPSYVTEYERP
jgi:uncharacterized protein